MQGKFSALNKLSGLLVAGAFIVAASLSSAGAADAADDHAGQRAKHRQEWLRVELDKEPNRLEITASQEALQTYTSAQIAFAGRAVGKHEEAADAARLTKRRAERMAELAHKLATLADATTRLQVVLSPEQRKILDEIVRDGHLKHRHHGRHDSCGGIHRYGHEHLSA